MTIRRSLTRLRPDGQPTNAQAATTIASYLLDIYLARHTPAKWIGTVEAVDAEAAAIKKAAQEFNVQDIKKLLAVRRRYWDGEVGPFARFQRGSLAKSNT